MGIKTIQIIQGDEGRWTKMAQVEAGWLVHWGLLHYFLYFCECSHSFSIMKWKKETPEIWSTEAEGGKCCFLLDRYAQNDQAATFSIPRESPSVVKCWDHPTGANIAGGVARGGELTPMRFPRILFIHTENWSPMKLITYDPLASNVHAFISRNVGICVQNIAQRLDKQSCKLLPPNNYGNTTYWIVNNFPTSLTCHFSQIPNT